MISSMVYVTFLIVTAIAVCGVIEAAPRPKMNGAVKDIKIANEYNEASGNPEGSSNKDKVEDFVNEDIGSLEKPEGSLVKGNAEAQDVSTAVCPPGYEAVEAYCYKINLRFGDFQQHKDLCFRSGGYLISIETEEESNALIKYLRSSNLDPKHYQLHIGFIDGRYNFQNQNQYFTWLYTVGLPYKNWAPGRPETWECGRVHLDDDRFGKWSDGLCQRLMGAICEANPLAKISLAIQ